MLTAGVVLLACLIVVFSLFALIGHRSGGWGAIVLGAAGLIYSLATYPQHVLLVIFPLSVLLMLIGCISVAVRGLRARRSRP